jgi:hypothetical protein
MGRSVKGTSYYLYHVVLHTLQHGDEALGPSGAVPELSSPSHHRQANGIKHDVPVSHGEAVYCVAKHLQCVADDSSLRQAIRLKLKGVSGLVKIVNQA